MKKYQKRNRAAFSGALFCILSSNTFAVVLQFFKGDVLDHAIAGEISTTIKYALLLISCILSEVLFYCLYRLCSAKYVAGCTRLLKQDIFCSILDRSYVDYKKRQQGEYIAKLANEADAVKDRRFRILPNLFDIVSKIVFVSVALFLLDWRLALITILLLTTPLYIPKLIEKRLQKAQADYLKAVEENLSKVNDWLNGFEIIKNFSVENHIRQRFIESNDDMAETLMKDAALSAVSQLISTLISYLSYFIVLVFAAWLVLTGDFTAGSFFVVIGMIDQRSYPLISLADIIRQLVAIRPTCDSMMQFIMEGHVKHESRFLQSVHKEIRYQDVSFAYPGGAPILEHVCLTAKRGQKILIKGPSGCGKTTVVNLLLRYYDLSEGSITVDGVPISEYGNTCSFAKPLSRRNSGVLQRVNLDKFASSESLDSWIKENGSNLSGGEKKRICLARALLRQTDVLILDEPLANLDDATASKIEDMLLSIRGKLLLVVSHQFSESKLNGFDYVLTIH